MMNYAPFDELRPRLEKQYENVVYSTENSWSEAELRQAWAAHKRENPDEDRILSRAFLIALILITVRRVMGWAMPVIAFVMIIYVFYGQYLPQPFGPTRPTKVPSWISRFTLSTICFPPME